MAFKRVHFKRARQDTSHNKYCVAPLYPPAAAAFETYLLVYRIGPASHGEALDAASGISHRSSCPQEAPLLLCKHLKLHLLIVVPVQS